MLLTVTDYTSSDACRRLLQSAAGSLEAGTKHKAVKVKTS